MSYRATVYNVMIASPGDVASERAIVREVIAEWNAVHSSTRKIVLLPTGWESHSSPEMGDSAQSIINDQVLDKGDLLVGVFWTRIGTQTQDYASGTVEEIERHISSGKQAMLYFSEQPARLDSVDEGQYQELKRFKSSCKDRGLYEVYDSHSQFKEKFYRHLQLKLNEHQLFASAEEASFIDPIPLPDDSQLPELSEEARMLLKEASLDGHGVIMHLRHLGGTDLQTNGKNLINDQNRRVVAQWEAALQQLIEADLVVERGIKGEIFEITERGFQVADSL
ncbi:DUF4062 domain-containing protein [Marinobacter sp. DUT-1]|uniref:DUF4062 domain-containing protein n=1 Tax=Marinobacter sp. DUT-1 TaxID=3412037 RepID=UPI003D167ED8